MKILEKKMKCIKCNKTIPDESAFCLYCGSKVENESTHRITKPRKITIERASSFVGCAAVYKIICEKMPDYCGALCGVPACFLDCRRERKNA